MVYSLGSSLSFPSFVPAPPPGKGSLNSNDNAQASQGNQGSAAGSPRRDSLGNQSVMTHSNSLRPAHRWNPFKSIFPGKGGNSSPYASYSSGSLYGSESGGWGKVKTYSSKFPAAKVGVGMGCLLCLGLMIAGMATGSSMLTGLGGGGLSMMAQGAGGYTMLKMNQKMGLETDKLMKGFGDEDNNNHGCKNCRKHGGSYGGGYGSFGGGGGGSVYGPIYEAAAPLAPPLPPPSLASLYSYTGGGQGPSGEVNRAFVDDDGNSTSSHRGPGSGQGNPPPGRRGSASSSQGQGPGSAQGRRPSSTDSEKRLNPNSRYEWV